MKKKNLLLLSLLLLIIIALPVYADSLESVRVLKMWDATDDIVIEREDGEKLLIQHNRSCSTMSTEFPVQLVWDEGEVTRMKVAANEICDVYDWGTYTSDIKIVRRIPSVNLQIPTHLAEVEWQGGLYQVDYGDGCVNMRDYEDHVAYVNAPEGELKGATLYLPKARGQCKIKEAEFLEELDMSPAIKETMIKNLRLKAENNQAFFSWDAFPQDEIWVAMLTYSKYRFNPSEYTLQQMPNLKRTRANSMRVLGLVNGQKYYFYIASSNESGSLSEWQEVEVTPEQTSYVFVNQPDPEKFEIKMRETDDAFIMTWPDKNEHSRKYMIQLYVDGVRETFRLIDAENPEFIIEKRPEWAHSRFRMTVRSIPKVITGLRYFDSIFWRKG